MLRLKPTTTYEESRARLSRNAKATLGIVEDGIARDPYHRTRRRDRADGAVIDYSAEGLLVAFRVLDPALAELIDVSDLKQDRS